jgi:hypothetical protein
MQVRPASWGRFVPVRPPQECLAAGVPIEARLYRYDTSERLLFTVRTEGRLIPAIVTGDAVAVPCGPRETRAASQRKRPAYGLIKAVNRRWRPRPQLG